MNHHDVLGVGNNASQSEIKKAFHEAAKEHHPDLSDSPEAAEAFKRIKEAYDALLKNASEAPRESATAAASAARASAATARTAYTQPDPQQQTQLTNEEIAHIQDLDEKARAKAKGSVFRRSKESEEIKKHRKKLKTNERRLRGLY